MSSTIKHYRVVIKKNCNDLIILNLIEQPIPPVRFVIVILLGPVPEIFESNWRFFVEYRLWFKCWLSK